MISLLPSLCELSDEDDEVKGFFTASLSFSVVVLCSAVSELVVVEVLVDEESVEEWGVIGSVCEVLVKVG